eukprot:1016183-Amphidinium_carterae.5
MSPNSHPASVPADFVFSPSSVQLRISCVFAGLFGPECNVSLLSRTLWVGRGGQALAVQPSNHVH